MVEPQLPKLMTWVRFPSPAPLPRHRQTSSGDGTILIAWENSWDLRDASAEGSLPSAAPHCLRLPLFAPVLARGFALDLNLRFQARIRGREPHPSPHHPPTTRVRRRHGTSAVGHNAELCIGADFCRSAQFAILPIAAIHVPCGHDVPPTSWYMRSADQRYLEGLKSCALGGRRYGAAARDRSRGVGCGVRMKGDPAG